MWSHHILPSYEMIETPTITKLHVYTVDEVGRRMHASAGVITGLQADKYEIGMYYVAH